MTDDQKAAYLLGMWHGFKAYEDSEPHSGLQAAANVGGQILGGGAFNPLHIVEMKKAFDEIAEHVSAFYEEENAESCRN